MTYQRTAFAEWLRTLDVERNERLHAETVDQLAVLERELADRAEPTNDRVEPELAAAEFY
jgi:hypothetical protein